MNNALPAKKQLKKAELFFNPFHYVAGVHSLIIGVGIIFLVSVIGYFANCRFDGLIDVHIGGVLHAPFWIFIFEGFVNWFAIACVVTISAKIVTKSKYRAIDVFGTMALARYPYSIIAVLSLIPSIARYSHYITSKFLKTGMAVSVQPYDAAVFALWLILIMVLIVFSIILMYRAFSVSCNARGPKAIWYFIVVFFVCEIITKVASYAISSSLT